MEAAAEDDVEVVGGVADGELLVLTVEYGGIVEDDNVSARFSAW